MPNKTEEEEKEPGADAGKRTTAIEHQLSLSSLGNSDTPAETGRGEGIQKP